MDLLESHPNSQTLPEATSNPLFQTESEAQANLIFKNASLGALVLDPDIFTGVQHGVEMNIDLNNDSLDYNSNFNLEEGDMVPNFEHDMDLLTGTYGIGDFSDGVDWNGDFDGFHFSQLVPHANDWMGLLSMDEDFDGDSQANSNLALLAEENVCQEQQIENGKRDDQQQPPPNQALKNKTHFEAALTAIKEIQTSLRLKLCSDAGMVHPSQSGNKRFTGPLDGLCAALEVGIEALIAITNAQLELNSASNQEELTVASREALFQTLQAGAEAMKEKLKRWEVGGKANPVLLDVDEENKQEGCLPVSVQLGKRERKGWMKVDKKGADWI